MKRSASEDGAARRYAIRGVRRMMGVASVLYALFVIYGSLVPLNFRYVPFETALTAFLHMPVVAAQASDRDDLVTNLLLYVPLAFLLRGGLAGSKASFAARFALGLSVLALCAALSTALEFVQLYFPPRTTSFADILANTASGLIGIGVWTVFGGPVQRRSADVVVGGKSSLRAFVFLYLLLYLGLSLFPFDVLTSVSALSAKLNSGMVGPLLAEVACTGLLHCAGKLAIEVAATAPLALLLPLPKGRGVPYGLALVIGALLGFAIEAIQLFLTSGISQGASVLTRILGMLVGLTLIQSLRRSRPGRLRVYLRPLIVVFSSLYMIVLAWANRLLSGRWETAEAVHDKIASIRFLPFYYHYGQSQSVAMVSLLANAVMYLPVGVAYWSWRSLGYRGPILLGTLTAGMLGFMLAGSVAIGKLFVAGARPDPTDALIAAVAAAFGYRLAALFERLAGAVRQSGEPPELSRRGR